MEYFKYDYIDKKRCPMCRKGIFIVDVNQYNSMDEFDELNGLNIFSKFVIGEPGIHNKTIMQLVLEVPIEGNEIFKYLAREENDLDLNDRYNITKKIDDETIRCLKQAIRNNNVESISWFNKQIIESQSSEEFWKNNSDVYYNLLVYSSRFHEANEITWDIFEIIKKYDDELDNVVKNILSQL